MNYYGWRITWVLAVSQTIGFGVLFYAFSVFIKPMEAELAWSRAQTSGAFSLALLIAGLCAFPVGQWVDRHGARGLMTLGSSLAAVLLFAWSGVSDLLSFYLILSGIGLAMAATLYEVAFTVVAVWFLHKRSQAMLIITLVAGLASTIFIPLATLLTETMPWRDAMRVLAICYALGTIPLHAIFLRRRPADLGLEPDGSATTASGPTPKESSLTLSEALRQANYWWLTISSGFGRLIATAIAAHSVPILLELDNSPALVAAVTGSIGLMQLAGRLSYGTLLRYLPLVQLAALMYLCYGLALLSLLLLPGSWGPWVFAIFFGVANGSSTLTRAALLADIYGANNYGSISGSMTALIAGLQTAAPIGAGILHDLTGGYTALLLILAACSGLAAAFSLQIKPSAAQTVSKE